MNQLQTYSLKEVAKQDGNNGASTWIVVNDMVYNVTEFKNKHPGGADLIDEYAGQDATRGFDEFGHSSDANRIMKTYLVGELVEEDKMSNRRKRDVNFVEVAAEAKQGRRRFLSVLCGKCAA